MQSTRRLHTYGHTPTMAFAVSSARLLAPHVLGVLTSHRRGVSLGTAPLRVAAAASDGNSSSETSQVSPSDATKYDALLSTLESTPADLFTDTVYEMREEFTVTFYEYAAEKVDAMQKQGDAEAANALDNLCGRVMAAADTAFGAVTGSLGDGSELKEMDENGNTCLTAVEEAELAKRWDAVSAKLAEEGELNAIAQETKNATSRRDSVVAILGRVPMGEKELRTLNMVTAERRIIDVLLEVPSGPEREEMLSDALTPPERVDDDESEDSTRNQMTLDDDSGVLTGEEEEVFTTPARLIAAVELAVKEAVEAGDGKEVVEELRSLRKSVAQRCDFL